MQDEEEFIYIPKSLSVCGNIKINGSLCLDGKIEGNIQKVNIITVNSSASCIGDIFANEITIHGIVFGNITSNKVHLSQSAYVKGSITTSNFSIDKGGKFTGNKKLIEN